MSNKPLRRSVTLLALMLGVFITAVDGAIFAGLLPLTSSDLGVTPSQAGQMTTAFFAASAATAPFLGIAAKRWGVRDALSIGILTFLLGNVATIMSTDLIPAIAGRAVAGVGSALFVVSAFGAVARLFEEDELGRATSWLQTGMTSALVTAVPAGVLFASWTTWRIAVLATCLPVIPLLAVFYAFIPNYASPRLVDAKRQRIRTWLGRDVCAMLASEGVARIAYYAPYTYFALLFTLDGQQNPGEVPLLLLILGAAAIVGNIVAGRAIDRYNAALVLRVALIGFAVVMVSLPLARHGIIPAAIIVTAWGFFGWMIGLAQVNILVRLVPPPEQTVVLGFGTSGTALGTALGGAIGGIILSAAGAQWIGPFAAVCALFSTGLAWHLRPTSHTKLSDRETFK